LPALFQALPPALVRSSSALAATLIADYLLPKPLPTGGLRSLRTSQCFKGRPDPGMRLSSWTPAPLPALRRRKILQFNYTLPAINTSLSLGTVPKTAAALANLQLHAQFHDYFSVVVSFPDGLFWCLLFRGVKRTRQGNSGFSCPDGGLPPSLSRFLSCS
jgi:hypothetical protein